MISPRPTRTDLRARSRVAKSFMQTPYRYFPIESLPWPGIIVLLPGRMQISVIEQFNRFQADRTDWHLFDWRDMTETFPDARIYRERYLGMTSR